MITITSGDLRQLIASPAEHPVLYAARDEDTGQLTGETDVWAEAYVAHGDIICRRDELDAFGDEPEDFFEEVPSEFQETADRIAQDG